MSRPASFGTAAAVLLVALWASGAPSMVYPVLTDRWSVGEVVTTSLFATYPVALVLALLGCGSLSDALGRRRVLLAGTSIVSAGTALFVLTDDMAVVFAGRALQGLGVGVLISAATAALIEFAPRGDPLLSTAVNTAATACGTATALVVGGALVEHSSAPTRLPFLVLLIASVALLPLLWLLPESDAGPRGRWRPSPVRMPTSNRQAFTVGVLALTVAFMIGAVFIALGAQIVRDLVQTGDALIASLLIATWSLSVVPASLVARRRTPRIVIALGSVLAASGCGFVLLAATQESLVAFLVSAVLTGAGYGLLFHGGLGLVSASAAPSARAGSLSLMYLVAYLAQGGTAVVIGWLATATGLDTAIAVGVPAIAALGAVSGLASCFLRIPVRT